MSTDFVEQHKVETYKSMISISFEVFKYLVLLNGGAAAGMLAAIDKIVRVIEAEAIRQSMSFFIAGLVLAGVAIFVSYFTQSRLHQENIGVKTRGGHVWFVRISVVLCVISMGLFCAGAIVAVQGIG